MQRVITHKILEKFISTNQYLVEMKFFSFLTLLLIVATTLVFTRAEDGAAVEEVKPKKKAVGGDKWKNVKIEDIEKEWDAQDDPLDVETEHDRLEKLRAARRPEFDINDPASLKRAYKKDPSTFGNGSGGAGTAMLFVDIYKRNAKPGKEKYTEYEINLLAKKWTSMLASGSVLVQIYNPSENNILINIDRGWQTKEVMKFIAQQREVKHLTLNNKKFTPKEYLQSVEDEEDEL